MGEELVLFNVEPNWCIKSFHIGNSRALEEALID